MDELDFVKELIARIPRARGPYRSYPTSASQGPDVPTCQFGCQLPCRHRNLAGTAGVDRIIRSPHLARRLQSQLGGSLADAAHRHPKDWDVRSFTNCYWADLSPSRSIRGLTVTEWSGRVSG